MTVAVAAVARHRDRLPVARGDLALHPGLDPGLLQVVQEILGLVLQAQDRDLGADHAVRERNAVDPLADPDRVPVRAGPRVADGGADVRLEPRRHRVLEVLGLLVDVIPGNADDIGQEPFDHPMAADDPLGVLPAGDREVDRPAGVADDVAVALEPPDHLMDRRGRQLHRASQVRAGQRQSGLEQPVQRLEVLLLGFGRVLGGHEGIVAGGFVASSGVMVLPLKPPIEPQLARSKPELPRGRAVGL